LPAQALPSGSTVQGIGDALLSEIVYEGHGQLLSGTLAK
jgi:hypothetical protein